MLERKQITAGKAKSRLFLSAWICLLLLCTGCTRAVLIETNKTFSATVLEKNTNSVLVEPLEGEDELKSSDKISVSLKEDNSQVFEEIQAGDTVEITYDGTIAESYPAKINSALGIKVIR